MFIKQGRQRLIAGAVLIHLGLALAVFLIGRYAVLAALFDPHGTGLRFASDGIAYMSEVRALVDMLTREGPSVWLAANYPLHVKIYSVSFAVLSPIFGFSTLSAEPLNLFYYVAIVYLVFKLGEEAFGERAGIVAAWIVALWPSFLLHTTQLLKDPLYIAAMLALLTVNLRWLTKDHPARGALLWGLAGGALCTLLWVVRSENGELTLAVALIGTVLVLIRQFAHGRAARWNLAGAALMLLLAVGAPRVIYARRSVQAKPAVVVAAAPSSSVVAPSSSVNAAKAQQGNSPADRVARLRVAFARSYPNAGSNVDADVSFDDAAGLVRHLPRALMVGLLAPLPDMWFAPGAHTGRAGRMLSGAETLLMYVLQLFTLYGLWSQRRSLSVWLLLIVALVGAAALGLVVVNVGALYRLRYSFWMPLIVLGAGGAVQLYHALAERRREQSGRDLLPTTQEA
ncbi:MAG TPA: hypothetical protein VF240_06695 [Pyrinomonadaceae bacterium]